MTAILPLKITDNQKHISDPAAVQSRYTDAQKAKIADAAKKFESLLTSMMLKSMNKSSGGMFGENSYGGDMFDSVFQNDMASFISEKQSLGVANILYRKITGESLKNNFNSSGKLPGVTGNSAGNNTLSVAPGRRAIERLSKYENIIDKASANFGVNKNLIKSVILTESAAREDAVSGAKAKGLMQLIDSTATDVGVNNVWDPAQNIFGGTKYLGELLRKYNGNVKLALASYNAGPVNVDKYGGVPPFEETQNYVKRVMGYLNHLNGEGNGNEQSI